LRQDWSYYNYFDLHAPHASPLNLREVALRVAEKLVSFVIENFDEVITSVKKEKGSSVH